MIELILTNTLDSAPILEKLKNSRSQAKRHLLFVPDRFSLSYQKAVLEYLNIKGTFDIEVTSFPRLANSLLKGSGKLLDKQAEIMLLRKVIDDNKSRLRCFAGAGKSARFANDMYAAISQIRNSGISAEKMAEIADGLPARIADKTRDIVTVYRDYVEFLQSGYIDGTSKLEALAELVREGRFNDCNIYISDFMSFSSVEYDIISALMSNSMNTYIALLDGAERKNRHVYPYEVKARLLSLADECGVGINVSTVEQRLSGDAEIIHKGLYSYSKVDGERDGRCAIVACADVADEIRGVAREINALIRKGARYRDMAIACCDFAAYSTYIKSIFDDFAIPFYADIKQPLTTQAVAKLLLCAMRVHIEKFAARQVFDYAKLSFVDEDSEEVCIFENYCLKYGIEYTRFLSPFTLGEEKYRAAAEKVRKKAIEPLLLLDTRTKDAKSHVDAVKEFLTAMNIDAKAEALAKRQQDEGLAEYASITLQSLRKIRTVLTQCESMLGESKMSFEEFYGVVAAAAESIEMSNIPLYSDCVFIGESSGSRYENIDYMFVVGASSGKFPAEHSDSGIVSDRECVAWGRMGVDVQPDCRRRNTKERLNALMTLTRARKKLRISYPSAGIGGEEIQPSSIVKYLADLLDERPNSATAPDSGWDKSDYARYVSVKNNALHELLATVNLIEEGGLENNDVAAQVCDALYAISCEIHGKQYVDALMGDWDERSICDSGDVMFNGNHTSVSQFEKYFKCPFLHFNENVLKLKRREVASLEVKDTGILLHAVLEKYFSLEDCADMEDVRIEETVPRLLIKSAEENPDYTELVKEESAQLRRLCEQAVYVVKNLVTNMKKTKFRPTMLEASFGADCPARHDLKGMQVFSGSRTLSFEGVIDRIDRYADRAIIIDYKSKYNIDFSPSNILYGDRIQLFVYLNALMQNGDVTPQGVFYLLMNNRFVNGERADRRFMHRGFVNSQSEYLADLDEGFYSQSSFSSDVYPIKRKVGAKGGVTVERQLGGELLDGEGFEQTCDYVMRLANKAAREIEEGYIAKSPLNVNGEEVVKACKYCDYAGVCGRSDVRVRNVATVDSNKFAQIIGGGKCRE